MQHLNSITPQGAPIAPPPPARVSKKDLAIHFGYQADNTRYLRSTVFTDPVLDQLQISAARYAEARTFTAWETQRIYTFFRITTLRW